LSSAHWWLLWTFMMLSLPKYASKEMKARHISEQTVYAFCLVMDNQLVKWVNIATAHAVVSACHLSRANTRISLTVVSDELIGVGLSDRISLYPLKLKLKLIYDRQSVGQSVLVSGAHLGPAANFSFSLKFPSYIYVFVIL
jgi:hypothetical protein